MKVAFCPNCGKRYYYPDLIADVQATPDKSGCGDCAQACVRPRELYRLRITDTEWDSGPEPLRAGLLEIMAVDDGTYEWCTRMAARVGVLLQGEGMDDGT